MFDNINNELFIANQLKYLSVIVFVITFWLIFTDNRVNILPLNIFVFFGSIILFHVYPNYYEFINKRDNNLTHFLGIYDFIIHYVPLIYVLTHHINNQTKTNYNLCIIILLAYFVIFHKDIYSIYFQPENYFKNRD
jgi:hypothetical protein